ncbi:hypothetical protein [Streptomyces sp. 891-h]|uniref:hypothetical protein n=1 Tax=Streptomyces sp. 891-h TaxID=2720714 RepID=UPI001FAABD95|nr:hypothetical protein [Streptomyces sp. 891-h]UNZ18864.1 hypothetical protein HC362_19270 [Streptomyces sp. 891-h]
MAHVPRDLLDRIAALEREVRTLRGRSQIRPALDSVTAGDVVIGRGGQLMAETPDGYRTFAVGQTRDGDWGVGIGRDDGTRALTVGDESGTDAQMIRMFSRDGDVIVMDDAYADGYLGRPWVPVPMASAVPITAAEWSTAFVGQWWVQHAVLLAHFTVYAPAGTTCEARLVMGSGADQQQLGAVLTASDGAEPSTTVRVTRSMHDRAHGAGASLRIQTRRTSGTGTGSVWCWGLWGVNATSAADAD